MPSESVASFLDHAKTSRLLPPDELDDLLSQPGVPQANLAAVCDALQARGALSPYQADRIRAGAAADLNVAGFPVVGEAGACPGGTAYKALHPSLRTPLVLRRLRADWLPPADDPEGYAARARAASPVSHPHLAHLIDAGVFRGEPFVTLDPVDGADLGKLVADIGPMPAPLAAGYGLQVALALAAAHDRGVVHGGVRPATVTVGPLAPMARPRADGTPRSRPAPNAAVKLGELGLVPRRPPLADWLAARPDTPADELAYLPPERAADGEPTRAGDVYGLGATIYFLLTGRPPFAGTAQEVAAAVPAGTPVPLDALRPDAPKPLVEVVRGLMAADPAARPTAAAAADRLREVVSPPKPPQKAPPAEPEAVPLTPAADRNGPPEEVPLVAAELETAEPPAARVGWEAVPYQGADDAAGQTYTPAAYGWGQHPAGGWDAPPADAPDDAAGWSPTDEHPSAFDQPASTTTAPAPRRPADEKKTNVWMWVWIGAGLNLLGLILILVVLFGPGCTTTTPTPPPKQQKK